MKNFLLLFLFLASAINLFSQAYHTIDIEGTNDQWDATESFTNCSAADYAYFTWDENNIYMGISDVEADYDNMATFIYFDVDPTGDNGTTDAYAWGDYIDTPFNADYVVVIKNALLSPDDYIQLLQYNNQTTSWDEIYGQAGSIYILEGTDTVVKFAMNEDYREFKINRSYIGSPDAVKTCMFTEQQWGSNWRYFTWPSNDWTDAVRAYGQAIPHYYGFILNDNIQPTDWPYFDCNITGFSGDAKSTSWSDAGNWSDGVPGSGSVVIIPSLKTIVVDADAEAYDFSNASDASVTVSSDNSLSIGNNLYNNAGASGFDVESTATGNGALIVSGEVSGDITAQCFMTDAQWHTFSAPVSGLTTEDLYLNANPEVWLIEYDEATKEYTFIADFDEPLSTMKGWMTWIDASTDQTYHFEGPMHTGTIGSDNNLIRSATGDFGYNFVGNVFPAGVDWDASEGWTKTNLNNAIYIYNDGNWSTYINGAATNQGSRYVAMNQGFFVQVADGAGSYPEYGTLKMDNRVCVTDDVSYLKSDQSVRNTNLIRLQLSMYDKHDETVIRFHENATEDFDGEYDAHKMFSYSDNKPIIWSTANDGMSINTLPLGISEVPIDVSGIQNINMTISASEILGVDLVYLKDNLNGVVTDLSQSNYTFKYDQEFPDRFLLTATITNIDNNSEDNASFNAYSSQKEITVVFENNNYRNVTIYSLSGVKLFDNYLNDDQVKFSVLSPGYYIVKVKEDGFVQTRKVVVN